MQYLFSLGREPEISLAELIAVLGLFDISETPTLAGSSFALLTTQKMLPAAELMNRLGGIVKISEGIDSTMSPEETISEALLTHKKESKLSFAISGELPPPTALTIKKHLRTLGRSVRAVEIKNSASIAYNKLVESGTDFTVFQKKVYRTVALQPFEAFGTRDFGRPQSDATSGMLPPKLARMMLNLGRVEKSSFLLDPFCGSGTILMEALTLGVQRIFGADLSSKAVEDTKINTAWVKEQQGIGATCEIFKSDVRAIQKQIPPGTIDAVVTEPFLGEPLRGHETMVELRKQAKELQSLYVDALQALRNVLKEKAFIAIVFPEFIHRQGVVHSITEAEITQAGFSLQELLPGKKSLLYRRPDQHVGRRLYLLQKAR